MATWRERKCEGPRLVASSPVNMKGLHEDTSRTSLSLTLCDSWDISALPNNAGGVEVPALLAPLLGVDFLPFTPEEEEEEMLVEPPPDVPRSVEITAEEPPATPGNGELPLLSDEEVEESSVKSCHRATVQETEELQELLIQSTKKKKAGRRFKAAARAVLQRVKKTPSISGKRRGGNRRKDLVVDTAARLDHQLGSTSWISPTATAATDGTLSPINNDVVATNKSQEKTLRKQTESLRSKADEEEQKLKSTHAEIETLQSQLAATLSKYQAQLVELEATQEQLVQLASISQLGCKPEESCTSSNKAEKREFKRSESGTFMRVHDLDLSASSSRSSSSSDSVSSLSQSAHNGQKANQDLEIPTNEFLLMDHYLLEIVHQLMAVGFELAADETDRFSPTRDTARLLANIPASIKATQNGWPIEPWTPAWDKNVLVWMGKVSHDGFGHTWPVVKGRAILNTSAANCLEYLWDSSLVPKYNPMCQGRQDLYVLQDDVNMTDRESPYGFAGCAKIVRSINKHRLLPKAIEMKILLYARPLEQHPGSYILVSRSVWENPNSTLDSKLTKNVIRTEMLMGCTIMRAIDETTCEMTNLTHVHSPGVPEVLAKKASPGQCHGLMKTFQSLFPSPK